MKLTEDKTIRLLPRLISGRLDMALVRPPVNPDKRLEFLFLLHETAVVAVSDRHPLASRKRVDITDLAEQPLIVPERRSRPHSHDLTMKLFAQAGLQARVVQLADEKQTIVNLVAAELGVAIVPRWISRMRAACATSARGARYEPAAGGGLGYRARSVRDEMLEMPRYACALCKGGLKQAAGPQPGARTRRNCTHLHRDS